MHLLTGFFLAGDDLEEEEEEELRDLEPVFDQVLLPTRNSCALVRHSSLVGGGAGAAFPERLQDGWGHAAMDQEQLLLSMQVENWGSHNE